MAFTNNITYSEDIPTFLAELRRLQEGRQMPNTEQLLYQTEKKNRFL